MTDKPESRRRIRSFVIRSGRMTDSQKKAYDRLVAQWSLPFSMPCEPYDFAAIFGNRNPVTLEIGFGMGDSLAQMASANPDQNFIGIEVHKAGIGRLLRLAEENESTNLRTVCHDAVEVLEHAVPENSLQRVNIYFPDPWHKKRHHKRRLIQPGFLTLLHSRMKPGGLLHIATDWVPYAEHCIDCVAANGLFSNYLRNTPYVNGDDFGRPKTRFERRGLRLGHEVRDMVFVA